MKPLFAHEFQYIFYNLSLINRPDRVAEGLRSLAYKLEERVTPTRAQRERVVGAMKHLPELVVLWADYTVRLWYYVAAAQLKDVRLALTLSDCVQREADAHLRVWCCLAADQSASSEFAFNWAEASQFGLAKISKDTRKLGREHTSLYPLMRSVLGSGAGILKEKAEFKFDRAPMDDVKFLLLALGRGQLQFEDGRLEKYLNDFVTSDGIRHTDPTIAEYSLWAARVRNMQWKVKYGSLLDIPCWRHDGVKHAGYRALAKDPAALRANREFLRDARKTEDATGRLNIALALTTRRGTYDSVMRCADRDDVADALTWHSHEVDDATSGRLFDFMVRNSNDNDEVTDYIIAELEAEGPSQNENLRSLNRRSRELPAALSELREKLNAKQRNAQQNSLASFVGFNGEGVKMETENRPTNFIVVAAAQELAAIRAHNKANGLSVKREQTLARRNADIVTVPMADGPSLEVGILLASRKGSESMGELLGALDQYERPRWVIMVGMMAGVKEKSQLLEVIAPQTIYNGQSVGTKDGKIVVEPDGAKVDPVLHEYLHSMDKDVLSESGIKLTTHKHTVTVSAKIDDWLHELSQMVLAVDSENIIGLEMEGWAVAQRQLEQARSDTKTGYIMIKGVADYAGGALDEGEIDNLKKLPNLVDLMINPDPTNSLDFKNALQRLATIRAYNVALDLVRRANK
jgi:nucleoside phosphorylase